MYTHFKENLENLSPATALQYLKEGNNRFIRNLRVNRNLLQQVNETREGQYPFAVILSCKDSRTSAELIFDQGLGDIFSLRVAGNVLNEDILGSMEYATQVVGSKIIVVLGHTRCGAIIGACDDIKLGHLTHLLEKVKPAIQSETTIQTERHGKNPEFVQKVTEWNVHLTMHQITERSPVIAALVQAEKIKIVGGIYEVETGKAALFED